LAAALNSTVYATHSKLISEEEAAFLALKMISDTSLQNGIVYVIGNGGSAGIASHFSADLIKACQVPSQTLFDSNLLTCLSNDWGYEQVFSYPLTKLLKSYDLLVAISSSGKSPNILSAAQTAHDKSTPIITLSG